MHLTGPARDRFVAIARERAHETGATLIREAGEGRDVFLMLSGKADVLVHSPDGRMVIYSRVNPGELVGVLAAIDNGARSASVVACDDGRTAWVTQTQFRMLMEQPEFSNAIHLHFVARIRSLSERVYEFGTLLVRERLGRELLRLAREAEPELRFEVGLLLLEHDHPEAMALLDRLLDEVPAPPRGWGRRLSQALRRAEAADMGQPDA